MRSHRQVVHCVRKGVQKRLMLAHVLISVWLQIIAALSIRRLVGKDVEFMVAHDGERGTGIDHAPYHLDGFSLQWPTADEISQEDHPPFLMSVRTITDTVFKPVQQ